jgi:hypothetical protein
MKRLADLNVIVFRILDLISYIVPSSYLASSCHLRLVNVLKVADTDLGESQPETSDCQEKRIGSVILKKTSVKKMRFFSCLA